MIPGDVGRRVGLVQGLISAANRGYISLVTLLETVWVMESCYDADVA